MEGEEYDTRVLVRHNFSPAMITIYDVSVLRVTASKDRAKLEIDPKIKILKPCQNNAYHTPD